MCARQYLAWRGRPAPALRWPRQPPSLPLRGRAAGWLGRRCGPRPPSTRCLASRAARCCSCAPSTPFPCERQTSRSQRCAAAAPAPPPPPPPERLLLLRLAAAAHDHNTYAHTAMRRPPRAVHSTVPPCHALALPHAGLLSQRGLCDGHLCRTDPGAGGGWAHHRYRAARPPSAAPAGAVPRFVRPAGGRRADGGGGLSGGRG